MLWKTTLSQLTSALWSGRSPSPGYSEAILDRSIQITSHLQNEEWTKLRLCFITPLYYILPELALQKGWNLIIATAGPLDHQLGPPKITTGWLTTTALIPMQFKNAKLALSLQMTSSGNLTGLRIIPYNLAGFSPPWQSPPYASSKIREADLNLESTLPVNATLTLPPSSSSSPSSEDSQYPVIILIPGSGPIDKDSTVSANKPFKDLAHGLATLGVCTLRFDKVTLAHPGHYSNSKITIEDEYMSQITAGIDYCLQHPEIDSEAIYLLGHSLGALIAPKAAERKEVRGCILMAAGAMPVYRAAVRQMKYLASLQDSPNPALEEQIKVLEAQAAVADDPDLSPDAKVEDLPFGIGAPYWLSCRNADSIGRLKGLGKEVLILQGGRDYQVTVEDDFVKWNDAVGRKEHVNMKVYERLNHLFVAGDGEGLSVPGDYDEPGHVDESVIKDITAWIMGAWKG